MSSSNSSTSSSFSPSISISSSSSMFLNISNPFSIQPLSSPTSLTTSSLSSSDPSNSFIKKLYQLEKELETIKIKKICFGQVSLKEMDLFLEKVAALKNEYKKSLY